MTKLKNNSHENYDRVEKIKISSEKNFGLTLGIIFSLLGLLPLIAGHPIRIWWLVLGAAFLVPAFVKPELLKLPNQYWAKLGLLLNKIVSPVILFVLFFLVFFPMGVLLRVFKKDILNLKIDKSKKSYWIQSESAPTNMVDQF